MASDGAMDYQNEQINQKVEAENENSVESAEMETPVVTPSAARTLLGGSMAGVQRRALVQNVAQNFGNKQVQRMLSEIRRASSGSIGRSAASGPEGGALEDDLADKVQQERANGQPLPDSTRSTLESSLGHDMSDLRVSVNPELNAAMGAKAFTSGQNVVLRDSGDMSDVSLLTHEATHAIQQNFSTAKPSSIGAADTEHEHAAEQNAAGAGNASGVQREGEEDELAMSRDEAVQREGEEDELAMKRDEAVQREGEEDELAMSRDEAVQREGEEDELAMMRDEAVQREGEDEEMA